jgi:NADH dehydrogenase (ubiquinone) flavoprotein 1
MEQILERLEVGEADRREIPMLEEISRSIEGHTICALGDAAAWPVQGLIRRFKHVVEDRLANPQDYSVDKYLQRSWSGDTSLKNLAWAKKYGDGKVVA